MGTSLDLPNTFYSDSTEPLGSETVAIADDPGDGSLEGSLYHALGDGSLEGSLSHALGDGSLENRRDILGFIGGKHAIEKKPAKTVGALPSVN